MEGRKEAGWPGLAWVPGSESGADSPHKGQTLTSYSAHPARDRAFPN